MDQNKRRIFDEEKNEYTFRTLRSLIKSINNASKKFKNITFNLIVTDTNSPEEDKNEIKEILKDSLIENKFISVNLKDFEDKITAGYSKAKFSNMANFYNSLLIAKNEDADLIYFVEDDYIHKKDALAEMVFAYEKFSSIFQKEIFLLSTDYPYLYKKLDNSNLLIGENYHWRTVKESLLTFLTSKELLLKYHNQLIEMAKNESNPFEKNLHSIYQKELCFSPVPSLSIHCANVNSVFGLSPNVDIKKLWNEYEI